MRRKLELLKLQIKSAFLSIPKIILGTIVTAVLVIAISTCIGIATAQDILIMMIQKTLIRQIIIRSFDILRWHSIMSAR